jgi:hypothetical protein
MQVDKNNFDSQTPEQSADQDIWSSVVTEHERVLGGAVENALIQSWRLPRFARLRATNRVDETKTKLPERRAAGRKWFSS